MNTLLLHGRSVDTVFDLMGRHENDMTRALGWALASCPRFLQLLANRVVPRPFRSKEIAVQLQVWKKPKGYTDVELESKSRFHVIVEAKRSWQPPGIHQLRKYAARLRRTKHGFTCLVILTDWSYSSAAAKRTKVGGVPVVWLSWAEVAKLAFRARQLSGHSERRWIDELLDYLGGIATMQEFDSNWVYVVSLNKGTPKGWKIPWIDVVESKHHYFHAPQGGGWPKTPPNYLAWRYDGVLQGIAHITQCEILPDVHSRIPEIPRGEITNHVLYRLGATFRPDHKVKTGKIFRSGRKWCMLDTLFTCATVSDAAKESQKRQHKAETFTP
jgi:hypothetical protein